MFVCLLAWFLYLWSWWAQGAATTIEFYSSWLQCSHPKATDSNLTARCLWKVSLVGVVFFSVHWDRNQLQFLSAHSASGVRNLQRQLTKRLVRFLSCVHCMRVKMRAVSVGGRGGGSLTLFCCSQQLTRVAVSYHRLSMKLDKLTTNEFGFFDQTRTHSFGRGSPRIAIIGQPDSRTLAARSSQD